jgi:hypothetical protein
MTVMLFFHFLSFLDPPPLPIPLVALATPRRLVAVADALCLISICCFLFSFQSPGLLTVSEWRHTCATPCSKHATRKELHCYRYQDASPDEFITAPFTMLKKH